MVTKLKDEGSRDAYVKVIESMYKLEDYNLDLMITSSESVERAESAKARKATAGSHKTQTEIVNSLAEKTGMKKSEVKEIFDALTDLATAEVKKNGEFTLPGFGKLVKAKRKTREGRNPATGKPIKIPAKTTVKFRVGKAMKDAVGK